MATTPTPTVKLRRLPDGKYATHDGRFQVEYEEWWLENECECLMCTQHGAYLCPNRGNAKRSGWTVWDVHGDDHLSGEPFEFETLRDARRYLARHLAKET